MEIKRELTRGEELKSTLKVYLRNRWEGNQSARESLTKAADSNALVLINREPFIALSEVESLDGLSLKEAFRRGGAVTLRSKNVLSIYLRVDSINSSRMAKIRFKNILAKDSRDSLQERQYFTYP